ncbi:MAG: prolipoprotein diacylglyceryl transferase [Kofleriaceae bacterium]
MQLAHSLLDGLAALPYVAIPHLNLFGGLKIEPFGVLVAIGVMVGIRLLDKYGAWHRAEEEHTRGLSWWMLVSGFLGAHVFDVLAYQWDKLMEDPVLILKIWSGISSFGGFLGGGMGFALYIWWKRLPPRLWADIAGVGLLPAFTLGRVGCTIVHDHPGHATSFALGVDYPAEFARNLGFAGAERLHNLALYELLYLLPINALILGLAFRKSKRLPAGALAALIAVLYTPVRFFLDYLRLDSTDPRYLSLTFAQWGAIAAFGVGLYLTAQIFRNGVPAPTLEDAPKAADAKAADAKAADAKAAE